MAHILVIDDNDDIRESIVEVLQEVFPNVQVSEAADGEEALEVIEAHGEPPALALLDIMMPGMNGLQFLDALSSRKLAPAMKVLVISGYVDIARSIDFSRVTGMLPKPFKTVDLIQFVEQVWSA